MSVHEKHEPTKKTVDEPTKKTSPAMEHVLATAAKVKPEKRFDSYNITDKPGRLGDLVNTAQIWPQLGLEPDASADEVETAWRLYQDIVALDGEPLPGNRTTVDGGKLAREDLRMLYQYGQTQIPKGTKLSESLVDLGLKTAEWLTLINQSDVAAGNRQYKEWHETKKQGTGTAWFFDRTNPDEPKLRSVTLENEYWSPGHSLIFGVDRGFDIGKSIGLGMLNLVVNNYNFGPDVFYGGAGRIDMKKLGKNILSGGYMESELLTGITEFMIPFMTLNMAAMSRMPGVTMKWRFLRGILQTGIAGGVAGTAMTPEMGNMADFLMMAGVEGGMVEYISTAPFQGDPFSDEGIAHRAKARQGLDRGIMRMKNAVADLAFGMPIDFIMESVGRFRYTNYADTNVLVRKKFLNTYMDALADSIIFKKAYADAKSMGMSDTLALKVASQIMPMAQINSNAARLMSGLMQESFNVPAAEADAILSLGQRMGMNLTNIEINVNGAELVYQGAGPMKGFKLFSKGKAATDKQARKLLKTDSTVRLTERLKDTGGPKFLKGNGLHTDEPATTVSGGTFSDLDLNAPTGYSDIVEAGGERVTARGGVVFTNLDTAEMWKESLRETGQGPAINRFLLSQEQKAIKKNPKYKKKYNKVNPVGAEFIDRALRNGNKQRFWYELGAEDIRSMVRLGEGNRLLYSQLVTQSAKTPVGDDLLRSLALHSDWISGRPTETPVIQTIGTHAAWDVSGGPLSREGNSLKVTSFGDTLIGAHFGRGEQGPPAAVLDVIMSHVFGIPETSFTDARVYEAATIYINKIRDVINENMPPGMEPYTTWQVQAQFWDEARRATSQPSKHANYGSALDWLIDERLPQFGIPVKVDAKTGVKYIDEETMRHPRFPEATGMTAGRRSDAHHMMLETQTKNVEQLTGVVEQSNRLLGMSNHPEIFGAQASADALKAYMDLQKGELTFMKGLSGPQTLESGRRVRVFTELASLIRNEQLPVMNAAKGDPNFRLVGGIQIPITRSGGKSTIASYGTYEGDVGTNMLIPLVDMQGPASRIIEDAQRWLDPKYAKQWGGNFKTPENDVLARRMLGLPPDADITLDDVRVLAGWKVERPTNDEMLDILAVTTDWTNQDMVYATKFVDIPGGKRNTSGGSTGELEVFERIDNFNDWETSASFFVPRTELSAQDVKKLATELGIDMHVRSNLTGTQVFIFAEQPHKFLQEEFIERFARVLGTDPDDIKVGVARAESVEMNSVDAVKRVEDIKARILENSLSDKWVEDSGVRGVGAKTAWSAVLTQRPLDTTTAWGRTSSREEFLNLTLAKSIDYLKTQDANVRDQIVAKLNTLKPSNKVDSISAWRGTKEWKSHAKDILSESELEWLASAGHKIGSDKWKGSGSAKNQLKAAQVGDYGKIARELRARSPHVRFNALDQKVKEIRQNSYDEIAESAKNSKKLSQTPARTVFGTSKLYTVLGEVTQRDMSSAQLRNMLKKRGIKDDEMKFSGLNDYLNANTKVNLDEAMDAMEGLKLTEVEKGLGLPNEGSGSTRTKYRAYQEPGGEDYRELVISWGGRAEGVSRMGSEHWPEKGVLGHVRYNKRPDPVTGGKSLFIEEIQSDWHQAGRREGYQKDLSIEFVSAENYLKNPIGKLDEREAAMFDKGAWVVTDEDGKRLGAYVSETFANARVYEVMQTRGVPDAPFKKNWDEMLLKRMVRYAVDNGYDSISWTTGAQQARRYDLSQQVDHITATRGEAYSKDGKGPYWDDDRIILQISPKDPTEPVTERVIDISKLDATVGKDLANKIRTQKGGGNTVEYAGLDLEVGGAGLKTFYDTMLVKAANKIGKKFGARVETQKLNTGKSTSLKEAKKSGVVRFEGGDGEKFEIFKGQGPDRGHWIVMDMESTDTIGKFQKYDDAEEALLNEANHLTRVGGEARTMLPQHYMAITDELKASVQTKGLPLFSQAPDGEIKGIAMQQTGEGIIIAGVKDPTTATALEEFIHGARLMLLGSDEAGALQAPPHMKESFDRLFGVGADGEITREIDEEFASAFIMYIREGVAPDEGLQPGMDLLAAQLRDSYHAASGGLPVAHLTPDRKEFFEKLLQLDTLPIQYADGSWMEVVPYSALARKIDRWKAEGKNWMAEIQESDVIALSGGGTRFVDDPETHQKTLFALDNLFRQGEKDRLIGGGMTREELEDEALGIYNMMMGRGEGTAARTLREYWNSNVKSGELARSQPTTTMAAIMTLRSTLSDVVDMAAIAGKDNSTVNQIALVSALREFEKVHVIVSDIRTAWGRSGNALKEKASDLLGTMDDLADDVPLMDDMDEIAALITGTSKSGRRDELPKIIQQIIDPKNKRKGLLDELLAYQRNNLLSRPSTFFSLSIIGPPGVMLMEGVERALGALASRDMDELVDTFATAWRLIGNGKTAIRFAAEAFVKGDSVIMPGQQWEGMLTETGIMASDNGANIVGALWQGANKVQRGPGRAMVGIDEWFRQTNMRTAAESRYVRQFKDEALKVAGIDKDNSGAVREFLRENGDTIKQRVNEKMEETFEAGRYMDRQARVEKAMADPELQGLPRGEREIAAVERADMTDTGLDDELMRYQATRATYQHKAGTVGTKILSAVEGLPILKFTVPFLKTSVNIFGRATGYSPTAQVATLMAYSSKAFREGGLANLPQNHPLRLFHQETLKELGSSDKSVVMRARGRQVAAMGIGGGVGLLFMNDRITGHGPTDPIMRKLWLKDHQPYSVKMGDTWVSYNGWGGHFAVVIGGWSNVMETTNGNWYEDDMEGHLRMIYATAATIKDQNMLTGFANFFGALESPERKGERFTTEMGKSFIPWGQATSGVERAMDPVLKDAYDFQQQILKGIPFLDNNDIALRYNTLGERVHVGSDDTTPSFRSWHNFLNPAKLKIDGDDPIFDEMMDIGFSMGPAPVEVWGLDLRRIPSPSGERTVQDDYNRLIERPDPRVPTLRKTLMRVIGSKKYKRASNMSLEGLSDKALILQSVITSYRSAAKKVLIRDNPQLQGLIKQSLVGDQLARVVGGVYDGQGAVNRETELNNIIENLKQYRK